MISFMAAFQALRNARKNASQEPVMPILSKEAVDAATNFCLRIGIQADEATPLNVRARVTCIDNGLTVMSFPAQHASFVWELDLPAGNYRLEVKGNNAVGGLTTADINGDLACTASHNASSDEKYIMNMSFVIA